MKSENSWVNFKAFADYADGRRHYALFHVNDVHYVLNGFAVHLVLEIRNSEGLILKTCQALTAQLDAKPFHGTSSSFK